MSSFLLIVSLALATPVPVAQQEAAPAGAEKKICKKEMQSGSRVSGKRVCLTQAEWKQRAEEAQRALNSQNGARAIK